MNKTFLLASLMAATAALLPLTAWYSRAQGSASPRQTATITGQTLDGLTADQQQAFKDGLRAFSTTETRADGLGPVFNGTACAECHKAAAIGGAGMDLTTARVTRIGGIRNGIYTDLAGLGGPVLQARSLKEFDTSCPIPGEVVPIGADFVSHRITTPLFGAGLIEAIAPQTILACVGQRDPDGVHGVANVVFNPETGQNEIGRFGWKAQHSTLHLFAGDAYLNEMGVTSASFPNENLPQGLPIPVGWGSVNQPEDQDGDIEAFTAFMRYLAPPGRRLPITLEAQQGERVFEGIRCTACHVPAMQTGANSVAALANQNVPLYSDLLLHQMGRNLADGIQQGNAKGDQFRTAPLWGVSRRQFFLHDGRTRSLEEAVLMHDGEATPARNRYMRLRRDNQAALMTFLSSL